MVPKAVLHTIVDSSVTTIKEGAFLDCTLLASVIMLGDNVKVVEEEAFSGCHSLTYVHYSKELEQIGYRALSDCASLEVLFLPLSGKGIAPETFLYREALRLLVLPDGLNPNGQVEGIVFGTPIEDIARTASVEYEWNCYDDAGCDVAISSSDRVNQWLLQQIGYQPPKYQFIHQ